VIESVALSKESIMAETQPLSSIIPLAAIERTSEFGAGFLMQIFAHSSAVRRDRIPRSSGTPKARP
jgi:hypothetical protein